MKNDFYHNFAPTQHVVKSAMTIDEKTYSEFYAASLDEGKSVRIDITGVGMHPFLKEGKDYVIVTPLKKSEILELEDDNLQIIVIKHVKRSDKGRPTNHTSSEGRLTLRRRDVVLFRHEQTGTIKLHRIVHVFGTLLLMRGDGCYCPFERATVSDVIGVVISGTCLGGHPFKAYSHIWSVMSRFWTITYRPRLWCLRVYRLATKSSRKKNPATQSIPA